MPIRTVTRISAAILAGLALQACGLLPSGRNYSAWEGHTVEELTEAWGEPVNVRALSADASALTWRDNKSSCDITFFSSDGRITGYSDTGC